MSYVYQPEISPISGPLAKNRGTMAFHRLASRKGARRLAALGAAAALITALLPGQAASAAPRIACLDRANSSYQNLLECVSAAGVREHLAGLPRYRHQQHRPGLPGNASRRH